MNLKHSVARRLAVRSLLLTFCLCHVWHPVSASCALQAVLAVLLRAFEWGQADPTERWGFFADMKPPAERFQLDMNSIGSAVGVSSSD